MTAAASPGGTHLRLGPATSDEAKMRLDVWLTHRHPDLSRARWQDLIKAGHVQVGGISRKPTYSITVGDNITAYIPPPEQIELIAEDLGLVILFEDADMIVINKPPGLVVHPAPGHASGTLVNALLHHCQDLAGVGGEKRPGIVHRLDQDTSGVLVAAKNDTAMMNLAAQFKNRSTRKEYIAVVWGTPVPAKGTIRTTIGRDPVNRKKMSTRSTIGREAVSHYDVMQSWEQVSLVKIRIETGRTHQIRVHLAHIKHPVVGDSVYGRKRPPELPALVTRQLLHAWKLSLAHPRTGKPMTLEAPWPDDLNGMIRALEKIS
jgi:23S rRNA pseudouridine1911/1915/1917 synthase